MSGSWIKRNKDRTRSGARDALAKKAKEMGTTVVVFDRGGWQYHGRVQAFAEGARAGGLQF